VLLPYVGRGKAKASGVWSEGRWTQVLTVRDVRVVRIREYETKEEALEAVGFARRHQVRTGRGARGV
jgi:ketosteroid isomerase-like protein